MIIEENKTKWKVSGGQQSTQRGTEVVKNKNWRLTQLMTAVEEYQGTKNTVLLGPSSSKKLAQKGVKQFPEKSNWKNEVIYRNVYITNPLVAVQKLRSCNTTEVSQVVSKQTLTGASAVGSRFPINANFVAQWLSENIVSSKTYKLSLLCDRVISELSSSIAKDKVAPVNIKETEANVSALDVSALDTASNERYAQVSLIGIKIIISGRILGAEIATSKTFKAGQIPSNTINVLKDQGFALAKTRSGTIGIKVIYFWRKP